MKCILKHKFTEWGLNSGNSDMELVCSKCGTKKILNAICHKEWRPFNENYYQDFGIIYGNKYLSENEKDIEMANIKNTEIELGNRHFRFTKSTLL